MRSSTEEGVAKSLDMDGLKTSLVYQFKQYSSPPISDCMQWSLGEAKTMLDVIL